LNTDLSGLLPTTVINSILVGGVYENKGQCKRPTAVLWVDMWMSQRALFGTNELIFFFFKVNM